MQYQLQIFRDEDHREFRTVEIDGQPWFYGLDVCNALDIKNPSDAYARLDADDLGQAEGVDSRGRRQAFTIVNESGLYSLILRSDKPEAKRFKKWITSQVLPAIRRTGSYSAKPAPIAAEWQPFHDRITATWGNVPEGYFSIFKEMADLTAQLITQGVAVDHKTIPDISLGQAWAKYWIENGYDHEFGYRTTYPHNYPPSFPQAKSNPQWPYCYPEEALSVFRQWVRNVYLKVGAPKYLNSKAAKGDIAPAVAQSVLKALAPKPTTPRLPPVP